MSHKFLVAVDDSVSAARIAKYLKSLIKQDDTITLYNVLPNPASLYDFNDPSSPVFISNRNLFTEFERIKKNTMNKKLEKIKKIIAGGKTIGKKINIKLDMRNDTVAHHIVREAVKGKYNTIVIGKHNSNTLTGIILGDITHKVIHLSKNIPVIVV